MTVVCVLLSLSCALAAAGGARAASSPLAPSEIRVTADVLDVHVVDSSTLDISPPQPLCVLVLKILTVVPPAARDLGEARPGETIVAYSKDLSLANARGLSLTARLIARGDERAARFWVIDASIGSPGGQR